MGRDVSGWRRHSPWSPSKGARGAATRKDERRRWVRPAAPPFSSPIRDRVAPIVSWSLNRVRASPSQRLITMVATAVSDGGW